jgi:cytochrome c-type biogenesis protein CcmH/NrfG
MSARTRAIIGVVVMSALLVLYFVFAGVRAVALLVSGTPLAVAMGAALIVLPLIGVWALGRELLFGVRSTALVDELDAENRLPDDLGEATATGRADRASADAVFARYREEAEASPEDWRSWARLGIVYDACGDRSRARAAMREAIARRRGRRSGLPA